MFPLFRFQEQFKSSSLSLDLISPKNFQLLISQKELVLKKYLSEQKALCYHHIFFDQAEKGHSKFWVKTNYQEMNHPASTQILLKYQQFF